MPKLLPRRTAGAIAMISAVAAVPMSLHAESAENAAQSQIFEQAEEEAIKGLVREYILENPEIIREAIQVLQERNEQAKAKQQQDAVAANQTALNDPGPLPVLGNPEGDVTIVEFFDYNCGYCRGVAEDVREVVNADGNVRLIMKELPILSESSRMAAQAAVAAAQQDAYAEFHHRLMTEVSPINRENVLDLARRMDLDLEKLEKDMAADSTKRAIAESYQLARTLGIGGTPAFVIGGKLVPGALEQERLKDLITAAREADS